VLGIAGFCRLLITYTDVFQSTFQYKRSTACPLLTLALRQLLLRRLFSAVFQSRMLVGKSY